MKTKQQIKYELEREYKLQPFITVDRILIGLLILIIFITGIMIGTMIK